MKHGRNPSPRDRFDRRSGSDQRRVGRQAEPGLSGAFTCVNCGALVTIDPMIAGVLNRNHCPYCLWSRHVDLYEAGDRLSACKAPMRPVGLTLKETHKKYARENSGELMLIHSCTECSVVSINRIAADDDAEMICAIFDQSLDMDQAERVKLAGQPIRVLTESDRWLVHERLYGKS